MKLTKKKAIELMKQNGGDLDLSDTQITSLPNDLTVGGWLYLRNTQITSLPSNLTVGGSLDLSNTQITSLPSNLTVGCHLDLRNTQITSLPSNLTVGGWLYPGNTQITELPNDLTVGGSLYLINTQITNPKNFKQLINGDYKENEYLYADNILTQVVCRKHINIKNEEYTYYKGKIKNRNIISKKYKNKTYYAHGENLKDCIEEVNFKIASKNFDRNKIASDIKARENDFIWTDYRLITGACSQGMKGWLASEKMTTENKMKIGNFYKKYKGKNVYAFERFEEFYNEFFGGETK